MRQVAARAAPAEVIGDHEAERIVRFGRKFHALSPWRHEPFDERAVLDFCATLKTNPDGYFACTHAGVIGGVLTPLWFAPSTKLAVELFWYSEEKGEGKRLRESFEAWGAERGAKHVQFSALADRNEEAVRRIMMRSGYDAIEVGFRKTL